LNDGLATITRDGITMRLSPGSGTKIREIQQHHYHDHNGHDAECARISGDVRMGGPAGAPENRGMPWIGF
jgi:hypothetical protein